MDSVNPLRFTAPPSARRRTRARRPGARTAPAGGEGRGCAHTISPLQLPPRLTPGVLSAKLSPKKKKKTVYTECNGLEHLTVAQLRQLLKERGIRKVSKLTRAEVCELIQLHDIGRRETDLRFIPSPQPLGHTLAAKRRRRTKELRSDVGCLELTSGQRQKTVTRRIVVLPRPDGKTNPEAKQVDWQPGLVRVPYFESSGSSNEGSSFLSGTFFPFGGFNEEKVSFMGRHFPVGFLRKFGVFGEADWIDAAKDEWVDDYAPYGRTKAVRLRDFDNFLGYFGYWFQVQQSAALGGGIWNDPHMTTFRSFVLSHNWNPATKRFERSNWIPQRYLLPDEPCAFRWTSTVGVVADAERSNEWLRAQQALASGDAVGGSWSKDGNLAEGR